MSYAIHKYNKAANSTDLNLKGLAIGTGLTDPAIQYGAYADFALLNKLVPKPVHDAMKLVSKTLTALIGLATDMPPLH